MVRRIELKHDRFYKRAKAEGYRSRSAFKLQQITTKFSVIKKGDVVIDLGAAPGGWSQVARELVGEHGIVISVDIQPMEKLEGVVLLQRDITREEECIQALNDILTAKGKEGADVVISDLSPQLSGTRDYDQFRSYELSTYALNIATTILKRGGNFVTKIFQGAYYNNFLQDMKERFRTTRAYSPEASRKGSAEVYVVGKGIK
jgi:23S rRNA (uridine2552-2'-O)-methyltransferase